MKGNEILGNLKTTCTIIRNWIFRICCLNSSHIYCRIGHWSATPSRIKIFARTVKISKDDVTLLENRKIIRLFEHFRHVETILIGVLSKGSVKERVDLARRNCWAVCAVYRRQVAFSKERDQFPIERMDLGEKPSALLPHGWEKWNLPSTKGRFAIEGKAIRSRCQRRDCRWKKRKESVKKEKKNDIISLSAVAVHGFTRP